MTFTSSLLATVLFLAYVNGANDNFKGVATLFGSRLTNYRRALGLTTLTTLVGALLAGWMSSGLMQVFSGKGLVPATVTAEPAFLLAVGLGAALTVGLATVTGLPISTTHALTGALVGAGWMAAGSHINLQRLGAVFFFPLAVSPLLAWGLASRLYPMCRALRERLGIRKGLCLCVGLAREPVVMHPGGVAMVPSTGARLSVGELAACVEEYQGVLFGVDAQRMLNGMHYLSAGAVSLARGLNDAPKIVALLMTAQAIQLDTRLGFLLVAVVMGLGGLLSARRVANTMSHRITRMNHGQGLAANLVTGLLVIGASQVGLPVSTTHVSCGALFGIGTTTGQGRLGVIRNIILSWIITLPVAALLGALVYRWV